VSRGRRRLFSLLVGCVLAGALAAVLFTSVGTGATSAGTAPALTDSAPGIDAQAAGLLQLNVAAPKAALPAPGFTLVNQHGQPTTLSQFRGKAVIWSLNDDQCVDLCALFAEDVVAADRDLGPAAADVEFLSVNANPYYTTPADVRAWSVHNDVEGLPNWTYVTGTPARLQQTWNAYKVTVVPDPRTRTVAHDAMLEFIDPNGAARAYGYFSEGALSTAYYAHTMAQMADDLLPAAERVTVGGPTVEAPATRGATIGDAAPAFDLEPLAGTATGDLARLDTKPLVLNFWSSTCAICTSEMPALEQVDRHFGRDIEMLGVDVADPRTSAAAFARRLGVTYPLLADPAGTAAADYRVTGLPVTFVIAPGGSILARHDGALTAAELNAVLEMDFQQLPQT
jgi:cytochrome oxidase Cu insertion factor (SCO1/SenC/PrrC family)/thiol-disulfide isomerase/thioredoxin